MPDKSLPIQKVIGSGSIITILEIIVKTSVIIIFILLSYNLEKYVAINTPNNAPSGINADDIAIYNSEFPSQ